MREFFVTRYTTRIFLAYGHSMYSSCKIMFLGSNNCLRFQNYKVSLNFCTMNTCVKKVCEVNLMHNDSIVGCYGGFIASGWRS